MNLMYHSSRLFPKSQMSPMNLRNLTYRYCHWPRRTRLCLRRQMSRKYRVSPRTHLNLTFHWFRYCRMFRSRLTSRNCHLSRTSRLCRTRLTCQTFRWSLTHRRFPMTRTRRMCLTNRSFQTCRRYRLCPKTLRTRSCLRYQKFPMFHYSPEIPAVPASPARRWSLMSLPSRWSPLIPGWGW